MLLRKLSGSCDIKRDVAREIQAGMTCFVITITWPSGAREYTSQVYKMEVEAIESATKAVYDDSETTFLETAEPDQSTRPRHDPGCWKKSKERRAY